MNCPTCSFDRSNVIRTVGDIDTVTRQRQCCSCGWRWNTVEAKSEEFAKLRRLMELGKQFGRELQDPTARD